MRLNCENLALTLVDFGLDHLLCATFGIYLLGYELNYRNFNVPIYYDKCYCLTELTEPVEDKEVGS